MYTQTMKKLTFTVILCVIILLYFLSKSESVITYITPNLKDTVVDSTEILQDKFADITIEKGTFSFAFFDPNTNTSYLVNPDEEYYYASIFKIPVAITVLKDIDSKKYSLADKFEYLSEDYTTGDGTLQYEDFNTQYSIEELLVKLLQNSDNVAMNIFIRKFGLDNVYQTALDLKTSKNFANNNIGTVKDGIEMFKTIDTTNIISNSSKQILYDYLTDTNFEDRLKLGLTDKSTLVHKVGTWPETLSYHDCGIVINSNYKYYICVLTKNTTLTQAQKLSTKLAKTAESLY